MRIRKIILRIGLALLVIAVIVAGVLFIRYRRDIAAAHERVANGGNQVVETACGPIEVAVQGEGPPVLVVHGAGGGYDQGLLFGQFAIGDGYQIIAPSRFGYLNSPALGDGSFETQADAYACLLDAMGIQRVAVVGVSAGGPSSIQFALRYPDRTAAIILVSAISNSETLLMDDDPQQDSRNAMISSDPAYWLALNVGKRPLLRALGVSRELQSTLTPDQRAEAEQLLETMLPMSLRAEGVANDQRLIPDVDSPLETIDVQALVVHARDDTLVPYATAEYSVEHLPRASILSLPEGGHFLVGQRDEVQSVVRAFLAPRMVTPS